MKKIRVLQCFGAMNIGGAETMMMNLLSKIDKDKYQCDFLVFSPEKGAYDEEIMEWGGNIFRLQSLSKVGIIRYIRSIENLIKEQGGYDIVHSHMDWLGGFISLAGYRANVRKRIVHSHAVQEIFVNNVIKRILIYISKLFILCFATDYLACSEPAAESLFIKSQKAIIFKNAIDLERLTKITDEEKKTFLEKYQISQEQVILGNIGGMSKNKNQIYLLKILEELNKFSNKYVLFLVGNGEEETSLKEYAKTKQIENVFWVNKTKRINLYLSMFDIFLFPSHQEGFGMVALEAQAMGVPCIVSDTIPESIDIGGKLVKRCTLKDKNEWISNILDWNCRKKDMDKMKNLIIKEGYDINSNVKLLEKIYIS